MRLSNVILVLSLGGIGAAGTLTGCGGDVSGTGGGTGTTTGTGAGSTTTGTGVATDPCSPSAQCPAIKSACLALVDDTALTTFTLRMSGLTPTAPPVLAASFSPLRAILANGVEINLPMSCNVGGNGTFSWLLQFDTAAGTLKTGGAKPAQDPTMGYSFVNETITQDGTAFTVAPFTAPAPITNGTFAVTMGQDLTVPVYLDMDPMKAPVLLPLHDTKITGTISADHNCIGKHNSKGLVPAGGCVGDPEHPAFIGADGNANSDGTLNGYITLEEADKVTITGFGTLCTALAGGGAGTPLRCKRDTNGKIEFVGDWCDATNDASCTDSVKLSAAFSASAVKAN